MSKSFADLTNVFRGTVLSQFVINVAFCNKIVAICNKTVTFCNKKPDAFCRKLLAFCNKIGVAFCNNVRHIL